MTQCMRAMVRLWEEAVQCPKLVLSESKRRRYCPINLTPVIDYSVPRVTAIVRIFTRNYPNYLTMLCYALFSLFFSSLNNNTFCIQFFYLLNLFLVTSRAPARSTAGSIQRDRGDHKIDELTRQVSFIFKVKFGNLV